MVENTLNLHTGSLDEALTSLYRWQKRNKKVLMPQRK